ncbi:hypothetical protein WICMUC_001762 [Wickerhamomyces mucosus]|uniref:Dol-P-Man:Man(5)GlcNAc(2)-PP-Dol alpha-1,3-mannosyltransferase n=1 Tax=Wickerhamomyces mucosus TaxID=1378264 RepID=A0A9P8TG58_9ASCO|nr:hypothetical protein WICMUC_001762 [Wickerhamomyces mucosus]
MSGPEIDTKRFDKSSTSIETPNEAKKNPPFTLLNVSKDLIFAIKSLLFDPRCNVIIIPILVLVESIITKFIIAKVLYTEIDYTAYIEQIGILKTGELDYDKIFGGTGPLVYPAGHVLIYQLLNNWTNGVENIHLGQKLFGYLYTINQFLTFLIYNNISLPPWCFYLIILSKRLHSIYVLRLFNDCFTSFFILLAVLSLQFSSIFKKYKYVLSNLVSPLLLSFAISIKMNALLLLPGFLVVLYFINEERLTRLIAPISLIVLLQTIVAYPFLFNGEIIRNSYFNGAFNFKRKFIHHWSINWKFLTQEQFNSDEFHKLLLGLNIIFLSLLFLTRWAGFKQASKTTIQLIKDGLNINKSTISQNHIINTNKNTEYITQVLITSNFVGILFARSLHYQFLSWYLWSYPILLSTAFGKDVFGLSISTIIFFIHEWCWNVYPSNANSSFILFSLNSFVFISVWLRGELEIPLYEDGEEKKYK